MFHSHYLEFESLCTVTEGEKQIIFPGEKFLSIITNSLCSMVSELYVMQNYFLLILFINSTHLVKKYNYSNLVKRRHSKAQPAPVTLCPVRHNQQYTRPTLTSRSNTRVPIDGPIGMFLQYFISLILYIKASHTGAADSVVIYITFFIFL